MGVQGLLRDVTADAARFDTAAVTPWQGLRVATGTVAALAIGTAAGGYTVGAAVGGGALSTGMASVDPEGRSRLGRVAATAAGMAVATFIGSATGDTTWLHVLTGAVWVAACGLVAAVEPLALPVGLNSIIAFLVFGRFPASPGDALRTAGMVAAGAALQLLLHAVAQRPPHARRETRMVGAAYRRLSDYARSLATGSTSLSAAAALDAARASVARSPVGGTTHEAWAGLLDEGWRMRLQLLALAEARERLVRDADQLRLEALDRVVGAAAAVMDAVGAPLATADREETAGAELERYEAAAAALRAACRTGGRHGCRLAVAASQALGGQLRAAASLLGAAQGVGRRIDPRATALRVRLSGVEGGAALLDKLRANLTWESAAARHALRLSAVVTAALLIAHAFDLSRGYWIGVTAALVLRPEYSVTLSRGIARAAGTFLGVGIASMLAVTVHPEGLALGLVIAVFTWMAASLLLASYLAFSVAITGVVVFLLATIDPSPVADAEQRLVATGAGAALALVAYAVWPTWGIGRARRTLVDLAGAVRVYTSGVLAVAADPGDPVRSSLPDLDRGLRLARSNADAAVAQSLADPPSRRIDPAWASGLLAALRRESLAAHALRARIWAQPDWPPIPQVGPLATALGRALDDVAGAIDTGVLSGPHRLRPLHGRLAAGIGGGKPDSPQAWLATETDEMVDAAGTLLDLLGSAEREPAAAARTARKGTVAATDVRAV